MPIYEYQCQKCDKVLELMQKFSDPPLEACPECGGETKKLISQTSFQLKGQGWYVTDYKKRSASKEAPKPSSAEAPKNTPKNIKSSGGSEK